MSVGYIKDGKYVKVASNAEILLGATDVRSGTFSCTIPAYTDPDNAKIEVTVTFETPMPDADYQIDITQDSHCSHSFYMITKKLATGFNIFFTNIWHAQLKMTCTYKAYRLINQRNYEGDIETIDLKSKLNTANFSSVDAMHLQRVGRLCIFTATNLVPKAVGNSLMVLNSDLPYYPSVHVNSVPVQGYYDRQTLSYAYIGLAPYNKIPRVHVGSTDGLWITLTYFMS